MSAPGERALIPWRLSQASSSLLTILDLVSVGFESASRQHFAAAAPGQMDKSGQQSAEIISESWDLHSASAAYPSVQAPFITSADNRKARECVKCEMGQGQRCGSV